MTLLISFIIFFFNFKFVHYLGMGTETKEETETPSSVCFGEKKLIGWTDDVCFVGRTVNGWTYDVKMPTLVFLSLTFSSSSCPLESWLWWTSSQEESWLEITFSAYTEQSIDYISQFYLYLLLKYYLLLKTYGDGPEVLHFVSYDLYIILVIFWCPPYKCSADRFYPLYWWSIWSFNDHYEWKLTLFGRISHWNMFVKNVSVL